MPNIVQRDEQLPQRTVSSLPYLPFQEAYTRSDHRSSSTFEKLEQLRKEYIEEKQAQEMHL
jgi:hypothetical protein